MELRKNSRAYTTIAKDTIDITDPCYKKDVWCRINDVPIEAGEYKLTAYSGKELTQNHIDQLNEFKMKYRNRLATDEEIESERQDIRSRIFCLEIQRKDREYSLDAPEWENVGEIGVDAGLAGFFWDKPDFTEDEWEAFCDKIDCDKNVFLDDYGFYSSSGYGDGCYNVYGIKENDRYVALKICFVEE